MKYHRLPNYKNGNPSAQAIIVTCSTDGRLRVFVNEKAGGFGRIEEEEEEFDDLDGEVPFRVDDSTRLRIGEIPPGISKDL